MSIMIPDKPLDIPLYSREDEMFEALEKLSDEYYVFHSFRIIVKSNDKIHESETDFVIFNPKKGIMCIEAKAGQVTCKNDIWYYSNGIPMSKGGPYKQADINKWKLSKYFEQKGLNNLLQKCKLIHAVWFPSLTAAQINQINMPPSGERQLTLTNEALCDPERYINNIFSLDVMGQPHTNINSFESKKILDNVLCPSFNLLPLASLELNRKNNIFAKMLSEQAKILDFLEDQPSAIVNGVAGTGKTLIAVEKARRHSESGDKVLFLCFNKYLCDYLKSKFEYPNVFFYTIDGFACSVCNTTKADFILLKSKLEEMFDNNEFPYLHIIVDEGQDFGQERIAECDVLELLEIIVLTKDNGTFYLFYDKNQLVQGYQLPKYIQNADCKLTLYQNCRNTENIATTSVRPLKNIGKLKMKYGSVKGDLVNIYIDENHAILREKIDKTIKKLLDKKISDIIILTCGTEENSMLSSYVHNGTFFSNSKNIRFTTCRKFKGLEADAVILVAVLKSTLITNDSLLFYVGASRAKLDLTIFINISENDYSEIGNSFDIPINSRFKKNFAAKMNSLLK